MINKCRKMEAELSTFWPEWHVTGIVDEGGSGDLFLIRKESFGIRVDSALKVIRCGDSVESSALFCAAERMDPEETLLMDMTGTRTLFSSPDNISSEIPPVSPGRELSGSFRAEEEIQPVKPGNTDSLYDIPESFRSEIRIMEALRGAPNVVIVEDYYCKREGTISSLFVRMELLSSFGKALIRYEENQTQFPLKEVLKLGKDICTALMYFEKKGISHRNITPDNIFIDEFGNYKVGYFRVFMGTEASRTAFATTETGDVTYMAPEVFKGQNYNNTVDTYGLGLVLYQILNKGRIPFLPTAGSYDARDIDSANYCRLHGEPLPPLTDIKTVDGNPAEAAANLDYIVRKACAPDSRDRFKNAREFYDALSAWEAAVLLEKSSRKKGAAWNAELQSRQGALQPDEPENWSILSQNTNREKKKPRTDSFLTGFFLPALTVLFLISLTVAFAVFILNRNRSLKTDQAIQSGIKSSSETLSSQRPAANTENDSTEIDGAGTGIKEPELPAAREGERQEEKYSTITDSWEEIIEASEDGTYMDKYRIGDVKEINLGREGVITMELVAKYEDSLSNPGGYAHMTWIAKTPLNSKYAMYSRETEEPGWPESDLRAWLRESILPLFPEHVRSKIKEVEKTSAVAYIKEKEIDDYDSDLSDTVYSDDIIWIPSYEELFHEYFSDTHYPIYKIAFSDNASREINGIDSSDDWWWLRSAYHYDSFYCVKTDGSWDYRNVNREGSVIIAFCL